MGELQNNTCPSQDLPPTCVLETRLITRVKSQHDWGGGALGLLRWERNEEQMSCSNSVTMQRSKTGIMGKEEDPENAESREQNIKQPKAELLIQRHSPITLGLKHTTKDIDIQL